MTGPARPVLEATVGYLRALRPDWQPQPVSDALHACAHRPWRQVIIAAVRVALDPATRHPGRLALPGPWWTEPDGATPIPHPFVAVPFPTSGDRAAGVRLCREQLAARKDAT